MKDKLGKLDFNLLSMPFSAIRYLKKPSKFKDPRRKHSHGIKCAPGSVPVRVLRIRSSLSREANKGKPKDRLKYKVGERWAGGRGQQLIYIDKNLQNDNRNNTEKYA